LKQTRFLIENLSFLHAKIIQLKKIAYQTAIEVRIADKNKRVIFNKILNTTSVIILKILKKYQLQ